MSFSVCIIITTLIFVTVKVCLWALDARALRQWRRCLAKTSDLSVLELLLQDTESDNTDEFAHEVRLEAIARDLVGTDNNELYYEAKLSRSRRGDIKTIEI